MSPMSGNLLPDTKRKKEIKMKRFFALLLTALLLIPVLAAAEIPAKLTSFDAEGLTFKLSLGNGSCRVEKDGVHNDHVYSASYYMSGNLESYNYTFDCGCRVRFSPSGVVDPDSIRRSIEGKGTYYWNESEQAWVKYGPEHAIVDKLTDSHAFVASAHKAPVTVSVGNTRPALQIDGFSAIKASVDSFAAQLTNEAGERIPADRTQTYGDDLTMVKKNGMYALYNEGELVEVYTKNLFFNDYWGEKDCRMQGNPSYGTYTEGFYDWNTGAMTMYKFYTDDRSMNAVYSVKNVLLSTELWDSKGAYWGYFDNTWYMDPTGEFYNMKETAPTTEVLEKILHAPAPAEYESACVSSVGDLKADEKGVPFILADKSAINNAEVKTVAEQTGARTTEFDISLVKNGSEVELAAPVTLTLGYPAGMPQEVAKEYAFAVRHTTDEGEIEVMSTLDGTVKLTANGPQVTATSFSPYEVIWGTEKELAWAKNASTKVETGDLPKTGDDSNLLLFAALLTVSCAVMIVLSKRRVKE